MTVDDGQRIERHDMPVVCPRRVAQQIVPGCVMSGAMEALASWDAGPMLPAESSAVVTWVVVSGLPPELNLCNEWSLTGPTRFAALGVNPGHRRERYTL